MYANTGNYEAAFCVWGNKSWIILLKYKVQVFRKARDYIRKVIKGRFVKVFIHYTSQLYIPHVAILIIWSSYLMYKIRFVTSIFYSGHQGVLGCLVGWQATWFWLKSWLWYQSQGAMGSSRASALHSARVSLSLSLPFTLCPSPWLCTLSLTLK